jgi:CPA1 family monovalent cation:H+ antiporter
VLVLATVSVLMSTAIVGFGGRYVFAAIGLDVPLSSLLVFGSLIAPTDPIAVGAILRRVGVSSAIETTIGGSLFNDGVGVVLFVLLVDLLSGGGVSAQRPARWSPARYSVAWRTARFWDGWSFGCCTRSTTIGWRSC